MSHPAGRRTQSTAFPASAVGTRHAGADLFFRHGVLLTTWGTEVATLRPRLLGGQLSFALAAPTLESVLVSPVADLSLALLAFGMSTGTHDPAMNLVGLDSERWRARSRWSGLHGTFSVGALIGSGVMGSSGGGDACRPVPVCPGRTPAPGMRRRT